MSRLARLFESGRIGNMELKNRLVMAATATTGGDDEGNPTDKMINFYVARAKGGVGFIVTGGVGISSEVSTEKSGLNAFDDKFIPGLKKLVEAVHGYGARFAAQLVHPGPALASFKHNNMAVGPSAVVIFAREETSPVCRVATKEDIKGFIRDFGQSAARMKAAGFDAVEINGGGAYLISAFRSPFTNKRTDEYGGSPEKRARFACEIIEGVRQRVGPDFPIVL
ncbi:NADH:flavin oxidoreductase, partial [Chloroflexota bacterium]